jgi:predicted nucleic acid-binding protein
VAFYVDTSALVKLVVPEPESEALQRWLSAPGAVLVASDLVRTELFRATRRLAEDRLVQARAVLEAVDLIRLTPTIFDEAARLDPPELRSLDAIHLASALDLGDSLEGVVTYDDRLAAAARANGVPVTAPA